MENLNFDSIQTNEDVREITGRPAINVSCFPEDMQEHMQAYYDWLCIVEAYRKLEGDEINWDNYNQYKWLPWVMMSPAGFRFDGSYYDNACADAGSGSRLRVLTEGASDDMAEKFPEILKAVMLK